jgi:hypothetical protein
MKPSTRHRNPRRSPSAFGCSDTVSDNANSAFGISLNLFDGVCQLREILGIAEQRAIESTALAVEIKVKAGMITSWP